MADQITHPAERAIHAITNAAQIAAGPAQLGVALDSADSARIVALLTEVPADIKALLALTEAQTGELLELREQGMRDTQCINRLEAWNTKLVQQLADERRKLAQANREVEQLLQAAYGRLDIENEHFNRIRSLRDTLHESTVVGEDYIIIDAPRVAAAGGQ